MSNEEKIGLFAVGFVGVFLLLKSIGSSAANTVSNVFTGYNTDEALRIWQGRNTEVVDAANTPSAAVIEWGYQNYGRPLPDSFWQDAEAARQSFGEVTIEGIEYIRAVRTGTIMDYSGTVSSTLGIYGVPLDTDWFGVRYDPETSFKTNDMFKSYQVSGGWGS